MAGREFLKKGYSTIRKMWQIQYSLRFIRPFFVQDSITTPVFKKPDSTQIHYKPMLQQNLLYFPKIAEMFTVTICNLNTTASREITVSDSYTGGEQLCGRLFIWGTKENLRNLLK